MLKKTITYPDLDENMVTEDFYFNLNKAEIAEMELSHEGGWSSYLQTIIDSQNGNDIILTFKKLIGDSIGRRSEDGKRFIKNQEIKDEFFQSEAYSTLFMELVTDASKAAEFVQGLMPQEMVNELVSQVQDVDAPLLQPVKDERPAYIRENRDPTKAELQAMDKEELQAAFLWKGSQK